MSSDRRDHPLRRRTPIIAVAAAVVAAALSSAADAEPSVPSVPPESVTEPTDHDAPSVDPQTGIAFALDATADELVATARHFVGPVTDVGEHFAPLAAHPFPTAIPAPLGSAVAAYTAEYNVSRRSFELAVTLSVAGTPDDVAEYFKVTMADAGNRLRSDSTRGGLAADGSAGTIRSLAFELRSSNFRSEIVIEVVTPTGSAPSDPPTVFIRVDDSTATSTARAFTGWLDPIPGITLGDDGAPLTPISARISVAPAGADGRLPVTVAVTYQYDQRTPAGQRAGDLRAALADGAAGYTADAGTSPMVLLNHEGGGSVTVSVTTDRRAVTTATF